MTDAPIRRFRRAPAISFALLLLPLLVLTAPATAGGGKANGKGGGKAAPAKKEKFAVGEAVKDLELALADGGTWSPTKGKAAVLVFAVDWSKESVDALVALGDPKGAVAKAGADRLGVLRDAKADKARKLAEAKELQVDLAVDPKRKVYDRFAARGVPFTVVIGTDGKLLSAAAGFDADAVAKTLKGPATKD